MGFHTEKTGGARSDLSVEDMDAIVKERISGSSNAYIVCTDAMVNFILAKKISNFPNATP